ncbi:hypothetical protein D3C84_759310 [compost metagenome]
MRACELAHVLEKVLDVRGPHIDHGIGFNHQPFLQLAELATLHALNLGSGVRCTRVDRLDGKPRRVHPWRQQLIRYGRLAGVAAEIDYCDLAHVLFLLLRPALS